ncbi:NAD(P)/FAD-dependent oxidoreductase [Clostridium formicaceticum]|uniref:Tricarballylate dehydrogenase n=1 Tax=Clostridium formicaceticum TaxID=1497 RepID=A0AAC9WGL5_9CLOT|nr:NAD(P)/FAD-dependent oxidoreductase [Clostridium formicaceticum]AOY77393.1 hypothetical protein BJL90_16965 [Clostridium formicaceticum]ARE87944.1 tricarballylate dehydrogenase [Clostridium formicaceticum]
MKNKKVIVVGGGPAGMMAAITAAQYSDGVILMEKNDKIGEKLRITGGGRCNITNNSSPEEIMKNVVTNGKFLYKSLHSFTSRELMELIEENGCPLKIEEEQKVFPASEKSKDIMEVFHRLLQKNNVKVYSQCEVKNLLIENQRVIGVTTNNQQEFQCDAVIMATGGVSYPHTGSTGEGHRICKKLGHTIIPLKPSLIAMVTKEKWLTEMMGISLRDIVMKSKIGNKSITAYGDLLFTHYGISGPAVFQLSAHLNKVSLEEHTILVDLLPKISQEELKEIFISVEKSNKQVSTILVDYLPRKFFTQMLNRLNISSEITLNQLNKKDRNRIIDRIKYFKITMTALRDIKYATVTSGGIAVKEVDPLTMASKLVQGLFFAGELLDVDALTGGFNLQIAFSTGYIAGKSSVQ